MADADHIRQFYCQQAALYERLVARQDHQDNLLAALGEIACLDGGVNLPECTGIWWKRF